MAFPVPAEFAAVRVTANKPGTDGVPAIFPVTVSRVSPAGRLDALKLVASREAVIW